MKKSCKGCKAIGINGCTLGYKTGFNDILNTNFYYPIEECPKPKTNSDYILWSKIKLY